MYIHRGSNGSSWVLHGALWVHLYTGRTVAAYEFDAKEEVSPSQPWQYNRLPSGRGELVLPVPGLRGPLHTIAPGVSRMPDGDYPVQPETMAEAGHPWLRIYWGDPDGLDDFGIHVGNTAAQSRGCPLPGLSETAEGVADSAAAMRIIIAVATACPGLRIHVRTITEAP